MFHLPLANTYVPVRNTIMKKPNMLDEDIESDELGYMMNNYDKKDTTRKRLHALEQLSPLRSNRMGPGQRQLGDDYKNRKNIDRKSVAPTFFKWRRLSRVNATGFSTCARAYTRPAPMTATTPVQAAPMQESMMRSNILGISLPSRFFTWPSFFGKK
jgi:hypothetical protein